ncbi:MAG: hypothetical protein DCC56_02880 [Anaerolineae bacterium]|nr:MAG: hypothetical protein DCC56_02880 [Anaerolineae bacterium]WKZ44218.1 MAG: hypothetical protein QY302_00335 [Anaerolineales bacterium]
MAKATAPLMSMDASGQIGKALVFQKGGNVRQYVVPANPKTVSQMAVRNKLGDLQRSLKKLGTVLRAELKSGFGARWNSQIVGELMKNDAALLTSYTATFNSFTSQEKTDWDTADTSSPVALTAGVPLYACAKAIKAIALVAGVTVTLADPTNANSSTVGGQWTANS